MSVTRRKSFRGAPAKYGCVGITGSAEFPKYIPSGYSAFESSVRLGSGTKRFFASCETLMVWKVQRRAGVQVNIIDSGEINHYGSNSVPLFEPGEQLMDEEGYDFARPGSIVSLRSRSHFIRFHAVMRVIYSVTEEDRMGFACGALSSRALHLEEGFFIEKRADSSVWFTVRVLRKKSWLSDIFLGRIRSKRLVTRYLRVLDPGYAL